MLSQIGIILNSNTCRVLRGSFMKFHKVKEVSVLPGLRLSVQFANCTTKIYDTAPLIRYLPAFAALEDEVLFGSVEVNQGGDGTVWNDELDLSCDELWGI